MPTLQLSKDHAAQHHFLLAAIWMFLHGPESDPASLDEGRPSRTPSRACRASHLVVGVGHPQEVVKALVDGQEGAINPQAKVPLANHGCGIALSLQHLCHGDLGVRQPPP